MWFEIGHTELLRARAGPYRDPEADGIYLVVVKLEVRYKWPARYDDELVLNTTLQSGGRVKIEHSYALHRGEELLATVTTVFACDDDGGRPQVAPNCRSDGAHTK